MKLFTLKGAGFVVANFLLIDFVITTLVYFINKYRDFGEVPYISPTWSIITLLGPSTNIKPGSGDELGVLMGMTWFFLPILFLAIIFTAGSSGPAIISRLL